MTYKDKIIDTIIRQYVNTLAIYLFGSFATEDRRPDSDIDIAILLPIDKSRNIDSRQWFDLAERLAAEVGTDHADLIDLRKANMVFRNQIIVSGERIYCPNDLAADEFEMLTMALYQQLQEERKDIIDDAIQSGRFRHALMRY